MLNTTQCRSRRIRDGQHRHGYDPMGRPLATHPRRHHRAGAGRPLEAQRDDRTARRRLGRQQHGHRADRRDVVERPRRLGRLRPLRRVRPTGPVLDTTRSYTVSAWVKLPAAPPATAPRCRQDGTRRSGFYLRLRLCGQQVADRWPARPTPTARACELRSRRPPPRSDTWTQLTGVYDQSAGRFKLYVNGALQGDVAVTDELGRRPGRAAHRRRQVERRRLRHLGRRHRRRAGLPEGADRGRGQPGLQRHLRPRPAPAWSAPVVDRATRAAWSRRSTDPRGNRPTTASTRPAGSRWSPRRRCCTEADGGTPLLTRPVGYTGYDTFGEVVETKDAERQRQPSSPTTRRAGRCPATLPSYTAARHVDPDHGRVHAAPTTTSARC